MDATEKMKWISLKC